MEPLINEMCSQLEQSINTSNKQLVYSLKRCLDTNLTKTQVNVYDPPGSQSLGPIGGVYQAHSREFGYVHELPSRAHKSLF